MLELPSHMIENENLISSTFGQKIYSSSEEEIRITSEKVILSTKNNYYTEINNKVLNLIDGQSREYRSLDSIITDDTID